MSHPRRNKLLPLLSVGVLVAAPLNAGADDSGISDRWQYAASIYLWGAGIDATDARGADVNVSFETLINNLNMAFMGNFEARRDKWSMLADVIYLNVGANNSGKVPVAVAPGTNVDVKVNASVETKGLVLNFIGGYTLWQTPEASLDLLAGARYLDLQLDFGLSAAVGPNVRARTFSDSDSMWDGVIGVKGHADLNPKWYHALLPGRRHRAIGPDLAGVRRACLPVQLGRCLAPLPAYQVGARLGQPARQHQLQRTPTGGQVRVLIPAAIAATPKREFRRALHAGQRPPTVFSRPPVDMPSVGARMSTVRKHLPRSVKNQTMMQTWMASTASRKSRCPMPSFFCSSERSMSWGSRTSSAVSVRRYRLMRNLARGSPMMGSKAQQNRKPRRRVALDAIAHRVSKQTKRQLMA